jgi:outer membrane protein OmpA-like peptidoglycan-associated protein
VFSITLPNREPPVTLETVIEKPFLSFKAKTPDIDAAKSAIRDLAEAIKKGDPTKVPAANASATLYALSLCGGYVVFTPSSPLQRPSDNNTRVGDLVDEKFESLVQGKRVAFPLRSAVLIEQAHLTLDVQLSVNRKLLEYPGWIDIEGLASPEWSQATRETAREQNQKLSLARAEAIQAAITASAGPVGGAVIEETKEILPMGLGFDPFELFFVDSVAESTDRTLLDPFTRPTDPAQRADYEAKLKEELGTKYPSLRRVDLAINGVFTVRLLGQ